MNKHLTSERHLRAKASKMYYSLRSSKNPSKKQKIDEDDGEKRHVSHSRVQGVWTVVKESGRVLYRNKLSGKTQVNKPFGLKEEDLEEESLNNFVVEDYDKVLPGDGHEYEEPELGNWQEVKNDNLYWFGGEDCENDDLHSEKNHSESSENSSKSIQSPSELLKSTHSWKTIQATTSLPLNPSQLSIHITEQLKQELDENPLPETLTSKPEYLKIPESLSSFQKRSIKGKSFSNLNK
jgi:hypothetical protein